MHGLRFHEARRRLIESLSQIIPEHFACQRDYTSIACILKDHRSRRIILLPACSFFIFVLSLGLIQETYLYVGLAVTISIVALISLFNALIYSIRKQHEASEVVKAVSNVCQRYSSFIQEQEAQLTLSMGARANSGAEEQALSCNPHISVVPTYRDGSWHRLPTLLLVAGDVIALMAGDLAPGRVQEIVAGGSRGGGKGTGGLYTGTTVSLGAVLERGARLRNRSVSSSYRRHRLLPADSPELLLLSGDIRCFRLLESICSAFCQEMLQSSSESATLDSADEATASPTGPPPLLIMAPTPLPTPAAVRDEGDGKSRAAKLRHPGRVLRSRKTVDYHPPPPIAELLSPMDPSKPPAPGHKKRQRVAKDTSPKASAHAAKVARLTAHAEEEAALRPRQVPLTPADLAATMATETSATSREDIPLDVPSSYDLGGGHIKVVGWNMNGHPISNLFCGDLAARVIQTHADVFIVTDTRLSKVAGGFAVSALKKVFRGYYHVYIQPAVSWGAAGFAANVGGQLVFVRVANQSGWSLSRLHPDPSGTGAIVGLDMHHKDGHKVRVVGVYMPHPQSDPHAQTPAPLPGPAQRRAARLLGRGRSGGGGATTCTFITTLRDPPL